MLKIVEYDEKYLEQISNIIIQDLLTVNSKDYGMERVKKNGWRLYSWEITK